MNLVVERVRATVAQAAVRALSAKRATLDVRRLTEIYDNAEYDCPVVVLTPAALEAAAVVVEVQDDDLWWVAAADGPGTELHDGIERYEGDRYELLARLVAAVVAGRYSNGPITEQRRRLWRSPVEQTGWRETYETERGPFTSTHFGRGFPQATRRFEPYF